MITRLIILFSFCITFVSCLKSKDDISGCGFTESGLIAPASEVATLQAYVTANRPLAIQHPSGFFYEIFAPGTGTVTPGVCSNVKVTYAGYLTSGFKFDENTTGINFTLGQLIVGWQKGLPLIKSGGSINLYLPPSLGYGSTTVGSVPANSILLFSIQLLEVQ